MTSAQARKELDRIINSAGYTDMHHTGVEFRIADLAVVVKQLLPKPRKARKRRKS